jgi:mono/diheme cytochrome c family protein
MNRLIFKNIETRIMIGLLMLVMLIIMVGWVTINEEARMQAFTRTFDGRSVENGAELYAVNCSECHSANGIGQAERAPGLANPHLFSFDPFAAVMGTIEPSLNTIISLQIEREALITELGTATDPARLGEISARVSEIDALLDPANEDGPAFALAQAAQERDTILASLDNAINAGYLPGVLDLPGEGIEYEVNFRNLLYGYTDAETGRSYPPQVTRLGQMGWAGDLRSFLTTTLYHGRPGSSEVWNGNAMVAWAQLGGGPLRTDEVDDLVAYMTNWDRGDRWTIEDFLAVDQYGKVKADAARVSGDGGGGATAIGSDVDAAMEQLLALEGDPARGQELYEGNDRTELGQRLGCSGCHLGGAQAPDTIGTWDRVQNERLTLPQFADYSGEKYLVESVLHPNDFIAPGYNAGVMLLIYPDQLSAQDLADLVAYMKSQ